MKVAKNVILHLATRRSLDIVDKSERFDMRCEEKEIIGLFSKENGNNAIGIVVVFELFMEVL